MRTIRVLNFTKVDPSKYIEGDLFLTKKTIGILNNGKIETLMTKSEVEKMIQKELKKVKKDGK